jgi:DNA-binding transcriptional regulator GbsR (MarR family)
MNGKLENMKKITKKKKYANKFKAANNESNNRNIDKIEESVELVNTELKESEEAEDAEVAEENSSTESMTDHSTDLSGSRADRMAGSSRADRISGLKERMNNKNARK